MTRRASAMLLLCLGLLLPLAACNASQTSSELSSPSPSSATSFPVTVKHRLGQTVIPAAPKRVVALGTSDVDVLYALGVQPVGIVTYAGWGAANDDGVAQWVADRVKAEVTTYVPDGATSLELIASLDPDLILLTYGSLDDATYQKLSKIAPTVGPLDGDWLLDWRAQLETIGRAVGQENEAANLEARLNDQIKAAATAHPTLAGRTYTFLEPHTKGLWVYLPGDPRNELIEELGLVPSAGSKNLAEKDGAFVADVSFERAPDVAADVMIAYLSEFDSLQKVPILSTLPSVKADAVVGYGKADTVFQSAMIPSPLTIPIILDRLPDNLATALEKSPN
ncbi:MAG: ABC transporter substrate-binding protein [Microlunatus sp.]